MTYSDSDEKTITASRCPLCHSLEVDLFFRDRFREYEECRNCRLVFVPPQFHLNQSDEKAVYDLHENDPQDTGYLRFLSRLSTPLLATLTACQQGLDFGCGPGPALASFFVSQGHQMAEYDPLYFPSAKLLKTEYDFICATEVVEHFRTPQQEFDLLFSLLRRGGQLGIMTKLVLGLDQFRKWHYIRDLTHVSFFSQETFQYIAQRYNSKVYFADKDVILLHKN